MLTIRDAEEKDFARIMEIYRSAQDYMIRSGNPNQWGRFNPPPERVLEVSGRASMGNMVNRAVVTGRNGRVLAAAQNTGDITACGRFQRVMGKSGDPQAQAKAALRRRSLSARVTVLGDLSLRCGGRVEAHRPQWGLEGVYDITAHEHRWEKGVFTTSLSLEGVEA